MIDHNNLVGLFGDVQCTLNYLEMFGTFAGFQPDIWAMKHIFKTGPLVVIMG